MFDKAKIEEIKKEVAAYETKWEAAKAKAAEKGKKVERKEKFFNVSGAEVNQVYTPADIADLDYNEDIGMPGEFPFVRNVQANGYRGKLWTMRQYAGFSTAEESNARYRYLIESGSTGLSCAFDLPTQIGYDSDDPIAEGEVGKVGVAIDSLADMEVLFGGIDLGKVSTSMTINAPASVLLAFYIAAAEKTGVTPDQLTGTIQNDILKEYAARGTYIFPPAPSMRLITDIFGFCSENVPQWNTISISGYHIREAGSTASQEVAFTLADGIAYVQAAIEAGLDVDAFAGRLSFFFNAHNDLLEEVAKFRAARRIWARTMRDRFKAKSQRSMMFRVHTQTGGSTLTAQQPDNNVVRVTIQTLAAVLGGTNSLHTNSKDEALALPNEDSVRVALRTQQIVAFESGVADTVDPLAGSYYVEAMTNRIEAEALDYIAKIDEMGGAVKAVEQGYIQREIQDSSYEYQKEVESGERIVVGVNKFQIKEAPPEGLLKIDLSVGVKQAQKLGEMKAGRDNNAVQAKLVALKEAAQGSANLMPYILDAARVYCTEGEICNVLRDVFGEYTPMQSI